MFPFFLVFANLFNPSPFQSAWQDQGIEGYVYWISGNQMPSPNRKPAKPMGMQTTLYIFELTSLNQVTRQGSSAFYSAIQTHLIKKIKTNPDGYCKVQLSPGRYSLFTKKGQLFYANNFDRNNNIAPVEVLPGKMTKIIVRVDYDANY